MATIKSYTDISQSRKLAEFLPIESANMYWFRQIDDDYFPPDVESIYPIPLYKDSKKDFKYDIPCWDLASLLGVLPYCPDLSKHTDGKWYITTYSNNVHTCWMGFDNPVDACVAMIEHLHKLKILTQDIFKI